MNLTKNPAKLAVMLTGWAAFHVAYIWPGWSWLLAIYMGSIVMLAHLPTGRQAFYLGMLFGLGVVVPQLWFFHGIFGIAAVPLWAILALWLACYLLAANRTLHRWPRAGLLLLQVLWTGFEYTRCELYYLRFAWLTPGLGLAPDTWMPVGLTGVYGFSFCLMAFLSVGVLLWKRHCLAAAAAVTAAALCTGLLGKPSVPSPGPVVTGIQLEFPDEDTVLRALRQARRDHPETELFVLSEYTFQGAIPAPITSWCADAQVYLIAGGKRYTDDSHDAFFNTAFVIGPSGKIVFEQAKCVPIQFFNDGTPAETQSVWNSPWGKIGLATCYDLSYTRVMDELVRQGAEALIVPTMDGAEWGEREHALHAKIAPLRAREYALPIVRIASSGMSQIVNADGQLAAFADYPAQGTTLSARLTMSAGAGLPLDRLLAPLCVIGSGIIILLLLASARLSPHILPCLHHPTSKTEPTWNGS